MPLKHLTETLLIALLGVVVIVTGILIPTLPPLPQGILPWVILSALTLAYPLILYPFLKANRADYAFRLLHFLPLALVVVWLLIGLLALRFPALHALVQVFTFGWTLLGVAIAFFLTLVFCLHVIRRWVSRTTILAALFLPFLVLSVFNEKSFHGTRMLTAFLWQGSWWNITGTGAAVEGSGKNLSVSSNPAEEEWRRKIREMEQQSARAASASGAIVVSSRSSSLIAFVQGSSSSRPKHLPSAGFEWGSVIVTLLGLYMGVVHARARKRLP